MSKPTAEIMPAPCPIPARPNPKPINRPFGGPFAL